MDPGPTTRNIQTTLFRRFRSFATILRYPRLLIALLEGVKISGFHNALLWTSRVARNTLIVSRIARFRCVHIVEFGTIKTLIGARKALSREWVLRRNRSLSAPDLIVVLRCNPEQIADRVAARGGAWSTIGRHERIRLTQEYYRMAQDLVATLGVPYVEFDTGERDQREIARDLMQMIELRIAQHQSD